MKSLNNLGEIYRRDGHIAVLDVFSQNQMTSAIARGGVLFHHGGTVHQSSNTLPNKRRRAAAFHYVRNDVTLMNSALVYDKAVIESIT